MRAKEKPNEQDKSRPRSNRTAGSAVNDTLPGNIIFVFKGKAYRQNEFRDIWINGDDLM